MPAIMPLKTEGNAVYSLLIGICEQSVAADEEKNTFNEDDEHVQLLSYSDLPVSWQTNQYEEVAEMKIFIETD